MDFLLTEKHLVIALQGTRLDLFLFYGWVGIFVDGTWEKRKLERLFSVWSCKQIICEKRNQIICRKCKQIICEKCKQIIFLKCKQIIL